MRKYAVYFALLVFSFANQQGFARDCNFQEGEARWSIKTSLLDGALNKEVQEINLESLIDSINPTLSARQKDAIADRRWAGRITVSDGAGDDVSLKEGDMISVEGFLYRARCQRDGDYHLEIGVRRTSRTQCLIVEAPDPDEIEDEVLKARVAKVRETLDTLDPGIFSGAANTTPVQVKITGQFFLDAFHIGGTDPGGHRGTGHCATNVWEIHPVTAIEIRSR